MGASSAMIAAVRECVFLPCDEQGSLFDATVSKTDRRTILVLCEELSRVGGWLPCAISDGRRRRACGLWCWFAAQFPEVEIFFKLDQAYKGVKDTNDREYRGRGSDCIVILKGNDDRPSRPYHCDVKDMSLKSTLPQLTKKRESSLLTMSSTDGYSLCLLVEWCAVHCVLLLFQLRFSGTRTSRVLGGHAF